MERQLLEKCQEAVDPILALTQTLVNMDSGTDDLPELKAKAEFICELFEKSGAKTRLESSRPADGRLNPVITFTGEGRAKILILTHYDTVFPAGEAAKRPFALHGDTATGPGVGDMQASIAMLAAGLPIALPALKEKFAKITVFCNSQEETGSIHTRELIRELAKQHDITLNMELSGANGDLITVSGRGMATGRLTIRGKSAHSAAELPAGVNAGLELAHQLLALASLSDPAKRTAVNATVGHFGQKQNVIPEHAEALLNIRVADAAEFTRVEREIRKIIKDQLFPESQISFRMERVFEPYGNTPEILDLAEKVRSLAKKELGLELGLRHAIGSNDTCFAALEGPALDGFGPGCKAMHSREESLPVSSLAPRLYILLRTIGEICHGNFIPLGNSAPKPEEA